MIKIRGPFISLGEAQDFVSATAVQGVRFKEFTSRQVPPSRRAKLGGLGRTAAFSIFDDPAVPYPDEEIVLDPKRGWIVNRPR